jgi:chemotaxis-related protein WspD
MTRRTEPPPYCWRIIGVDGDLSCRELAKVIHCRNCPVLSSAARELSRWPQPEGYAEMWGRRIADVPPAIPAIVSIIPFRLGSQWLAIETKFFVEIAPARFVHQIPHRVGTLLEGLVNIRGELVLCVAVSRLLGIPMQAGGNETARLAVIEHGGGQWVFRVNEVMGVLRVERALVTPAPATLPPVLASMTTGLTMIGGQTVSILSGESLATSLRQAAG